MSKVGPENLPPSMDRLARADQFIPPLSALTAIPGRMGGYRRYAVVAEQPERVTRAFGLAAPAWAARGYNNWMYVLETPDGRIGSRAMRYV